MESWWQRIRPEARSAFGVRWGGVAIPRVYGERYFHDRHTSPLISATHIQTGATNIQLGG